VTFVVRRAAPGDEAVLRAIRIEALTEAPEAFGSTLERELARTPEDWRRWMSPGTVFILYDAGGQARGLVAGAAREDDPSAVQLMAMWVHPSLRGSGAAEALVAALAAWAAQRGVREIQLRVVKANERARRLYEREGFRQFGEEIIRPRDGAVEIEMRVQATLARPYPSNAGNEDL
jgi:ribosomal protein S18 acetylase RimI-like enzyme